METWVVLVEATHDGAGGTIDQDELGALLTALNCAGSGRALHSPDRYALQVTTAGSDPAEALLRVLSSWSDAVRELALPRWEVVRTEVLRPAELKRDLGTVDAVGWQSPLGVRRPERRDSISDQPRLTRPRAFLAPRPA